MLPENNGHSSPSSALERQVAMGLDRPGQHPEIEVDLEELIVDDDGDTEEE